MTDFAKRQYDSSFGGTVVTPEQVEQLIQMATKPAKVNPGYADFCKIIAIDNRNVDTFHLPFEHLSINREEALKSGAKLHSAYEARRPEELAVLVEWVTGIEAPKANFIHLILYDREQLSKEDEIIQADWGIVSIATAANIDEEPMRPITMMRNALGIEEGGSGVSINREAYSKSVAYWSENIMIRQ